MDKKAAAAYLEISVRSVERLSSSGRLTKKSVVRNGHRIVGFDDEELARLKKDRDTPETMSVKPPKFEPPRDIVAFRLDPYYVGRLIEEGAKSNLSAGEYARQIVIRRLEEPEASATLSELVRIRKGVGRLFLAILTKGFKVKSAEAECLIRDALGD